MFSLLQSPKNAPEDQPRRGSCRTMLFQHIAHNWEGVNKQLQGLAVIEEALPKQLAIKASVRDFDSKNANRDSHALKYSKHFDFQKYAIIPNLLKKQDEERYYHSEGSLSFSSGVEMPPKQSHGRDIVRPILPDFRIQGSFNFNATDFGVSLPSFLLVQD